MDRIKRFDEFTKPIMEVSVEGSYLNDITVSSDKFEGPFAQAPRTKGKTWGLKFENWRGKKNYYLVKFPDKFKQQIVEVITAKGESITLEEVDNYEIYIECEGEDGFNRTHFSGGIPSKLRGINLGYIIYEEFIKYLGFASSNYSSTSLAQKVWRKIADDPDFLGICYKYGIIVFDASMDKVQMSNVALLYLSNQGINTDFGVEEIDEILNRLKSEGVNIDYKLIEIIKSDEQYNSSEFKLKKLLQDLENIYAIEIHFRNGLIEKHQLFSRDDDYPYLKSYQYIKDKILPEVEKLKKIDGDKWGETAKKTEAKIKDKFNSCEIKLKQSIEDGLTNAYNKYNLQKVEEDIKKLSEVIKELDLRNEVIQSIGSFKYYDLRKKLNELFRTEGYQKTLDYYSNQGKEELNKIMAMFENTNLKNVPDDYTWAQGLFKTYPKQFPEVEGQDIKTISLTVEQHISLQMRAYKMILIASYDKIVNKMKKAYLEGGYEKAKSYFDSVDKKKIDQITIEIEDNNGYGLTKGNLVKLPAMEHLNRRLLTYSKNPTPPAKPIVQKPLETTVVKKPQSETEKTKSEKPMLQRFKDFFNL
jgi:hypothetical protein